MILCRSLLLASLVSTLLTLSSAYIVTTEIWEPDKPLVPGLTLFYNVVVEAKDTIVLVDITMHNGERGNTTVIFGDSDLRKQFDRNAGFDVPMVPPGKRYTVRVVETSTQRFLADSPPFEIFALNGAPSSSSTRVSSTTPLIRPSDTTARAPSSTRNGPSASSPAASSPSVSSPSASAPAASAPSASTPSVSTPSASAPSASGPAASAPSASAPAVSAPAVSAPAASAPAETESSKTPVGAIAGGVVGGILVIALIILFLLCRRRRHARPSHDVEGEKNLGPPPLGPHAVEPYTLPPSAVPESAAASHPSLTGTGTDARSTAGLLPSKLEPYGSSLDAGASSSAMYAPMPMSATMSSPTSTELTRVEQLRRERERINRELAALENRSYTTSSSSYGGASSYMNPSPVGSGSNHESLAEQLAALQTQIRQLEERERHRESDLPPVYDGPPAPVTNTNADTSPTRYPVDSKH